MDEGYQQMDLETYSLTLKQCLENLWNISWSIITIIEDIQRMRQLCNTEIMHIYREDNTLADYLANFSFDIQGRQIFTQFSQLPVKERKLLNIDKKQIPNLRIRTKEIKDSYGTN